MRCVLIQDSSAILALCTSYIDRLDHSPYAVPSWKKFKSFVLLLAFNEETLKPDTDNQGASEVERNTSLLIDQSFTNLEIDHDGSVVASHQGLPSCFGAHNFVGYTALAYSPLSGLPLQRGGNEPIAEVSTEAYLISFLIIPSVRGRGFGKALLEFGVALSRTRFNTTRIRLHVLDAASTEKGDQTPQGKGTSSASAAGHVYRSAGFQVRRRIPDYYGKGQDGLEMMLALAGVGTGQPETATRKRGRFD